MNCRRARPLLALMAGGDLPERKSRGVLKHLERCADCAAELEALEASIAAARGIAAADLPRPLPADFDRIVERSIAARHPERIRRTGSREARAFLAQWRVLAAAGAIALVLIGLYAVRGADWRAHWRARRLAGRSVAPPSETPAAIPSPAAEREVRWSELTEEFGSCIEGPYRLADWKVPEAAGVFAIMHRSDPAGSSDAYVIDYCGESDRLSRSRSYPWYEQRMRRLVARAGSEENVYIAVCILERSSRADRVKIERAIIDRCTPYFNVRKGV